MGLYFRREMDRLLAIDVGAGTQDILLFESGKPIENCVKLVLPSRSTVVAQKTKAATAQGKDIFLRGNLMGGGPNVSALKAHLRAGYRVFATPLAAKTIRDDPNEVRAMGVEIVEEPPDEAIVIETRDVDLRSLERALALFNLELPREYAIAVQDHGEKPGISQRRFRFQQWERFVKAGGQLESLVYREVPPYLTRMQAVQRDAPGSLMMDTGSAAIWGALCDEVVAARQDEGLIVVNVGNQHLLAALVKGERIWGLFEHHTILMNREKLVDHIERLRQGLLTNEEVYEDHGHGAFIHPDYQGPFQLVTITGPNRRMAEGLGYMAVPYGDMMLTGCFGLVAAAQTLLSD
jgi:uncharacterized protein (DUF1786 family)